MAELRAVREGETAIPRSLADAVAKGSARDVLVTSRRQIAEKLDANEVASNALTAAYKQLVEFDRLIRQIDAETAAQEAEKDDEIRRRRRFNSAAL